MLKCVGVALLVVACHAAPSFCSFEDLYPKQYVAYKTPTPPVIDGNLDDEVWSEVPWTEDFIDISTTVVPRFRTRAKLRWDDTHLYVGGHLEEPQIWANITAHDQVIFHDNDFEVFVNPDATTHMYKEWEMNANNATWDLCLNKPYLNGGYENSSRVFPQHGFDEPLARSGVYIDGALNNPAVKSSFWSTEIAYRLVDLAYNETVQLPPPENTLWRLQFSRVEHRVEVVNGHFEKVPNVPLDNWVWTPMGVIDVHLPEKWGFLQFSSAAVNSTAPLRDPSWTVRSVAMQVYYAQIAFFEVHGMYADSLLPLFNLAPEGPRAIDGTCSVKPSLSLSPDGSHYNASVTSLDGSMTAHVRDDRFLTVSTR